MFWFKDKESQEEKNVTRVPYEILGSPVQGRAVDSSKIPDPTFADEILGKGIAVEPTDDKIYSPVDGTVEMIFETKHAISIRSNCGTQIMIHVGMDTVKLNGEPFKLNVVAGQEVKRGELLMDVNFSMIRESGYDTTTPVIICNSDLYSEVNKKTAKYVEPGDPIIELFK